MSARTTDKAQTIMRDPLRNRGTAFNADQRRALGLVGRLPSAIESLDEQASRCYEQLSRRRTAMDPPRRSTPDVADATEEPPLGGCLPSGR